MKEFDLIIIGGGAAGFAALLKAEEFGARTLMVNNTAVGMGGTCVNEGCLPTKHLLYIGDAIRMLKLQKFKGITYSVTFDFKTLIEEKNKLIQKLRKEKYLKVLDGLSHVEFIEGEARVVSTNKIKVNGQIFQSARFIVATGSSTSIPSIEGMDKVDYLTNREALQLEELPQSLIIIGGGPLGVEFAQMFARFGTKVSLLQRRDRILHREEPELSELLKRYLIEEGVKIFTRATIKSVATIGKEKQVLVSIDGEEEDFRAEALLVASGRRPNTRGWELEKWPLEFGPKGEIRVDEYLQAAENVWAAGDVIGEPMLETVAAREGMIAAQNALSAEKIRMDYRVVPHAIFTDPQLASVGLTDEKAVEEGFRCQCHTIPMGVVPKAQAIAETKGVIKMVTQKAREILGIHILAHSAADLIEEGAMIIRNRMTVDDLIQTLHVFPTLSEAIKLAAQSFRRDVEKMTCCAE